MRFCPNCGTRLRFKVVKTESETLPALACDKCGFYDKAEKAVVKPEESIVAGGQQASIKVVGEQEEKIQTMPTTAIECPKCGFNTAYWWMLQTRSGDEPPTQFFRCQQCGHTWRQYS